MPLCDYRHHGENDTALLQFEINNVSRSVLRDRERLDFIQKKAFSLGIAVEPRALLNCPYHMAACAVLRKYSPELCPYSLSLGRLTFLAIRATAQSPCISIAQKLALMLWVLAASLAARPIALWLIEVRYAPSRRPRWAKKLLSAICLKARKQHSLKRFLANRAIR